MPGSVTSAFTEAADFETALREGGASACSSPVPEHFARG
jgi:hypothetical protein